MENASSVRIRRGQPADAAALAELGARTFRDAFGDQNNPDDLEAYLASAYSPLHQARELESPDIITIVAENGDRLAGFAQVRRANTPDVVTGEAPLELGRFYVDRPWQGTGLAQRLMEAVHAAANDLDGRTIWLSVWERNGRAIAFYAKWGFEDVGTRDFWVGADRQTDRVMVSAVQGRGQRATANR